MAPTQPSTKTAWRAWGSAQRGALSTKARTKADAAINEHLLALLGSRTVKGALVLIPMHHGDEPDLQETATWCRQHGRIVLRPRVRTDGASFDAVLATHDDAAQPGYQGIPEPPAHAPAAAIADVDVVLVPALVFDHQGHRIGYGGGMFDRFLAEARLDTLTVGYAYARQVVDVPLPGDAHDIPVALILDENGCRACGEDCGLS